MDTLLCIKLCLFDRKGFNVWVFHLYVDRTSGYKTFLKIQTHEDEYVEKKQVWSLIASETSITQSHIWQVVQFSTAVCLQILNHLRKVKSCLEEEMCIVSGEKAKKESEETAASRKRPRQARDGGNEKKEGIREEKKQLEKRIEQLEKRVEHLDNKNIPPSDISHFPVQEEHLFHQMNMNQVVKNHPVS